MTTVLTFWGHSCISLDRDGRRLVVDPGCFSSPLALVGARAVLVTHEHPDHVVVDALVDALVADPVLEVWGPEVVIEQLVAAGGAGARVHPVQGEEQFQAAGFDVRTVGDSHAVIHADLPAVPNIGYLLDGRVLHPGDCLTPAPEGASIEVLLVPIAAPWLQLADAIDYVRAVDPWIVVPVHEAHLSLDGRSLADRLLKSLGAGEFRRQGVGESFALAES